MTPRARLYRLLLALAAIGVAAAIVVVVVTKDGGDGGTGGEAGSRYRLSYPASWQPLRATETRRLGGSVRLAIRRRDRKGIVVLKARGPLTTDLKSFGTDLVRSLRQRTRDFKLQSARRVRVRAGGAFLVTYVRSRSASVHSLLVVPTERVTYVLEGTTRGGAKAVAREMGRILASFDL